MLQKYYIFFTGFDSLLFVYLEVVSFVRLKCPNECCNRIIIYFLLVLHGNVNLLLQGFNIFDFQQILHAI